MNSKPNDKLPILLSSVTLVVVVITLVVIALYRAPNQTAGIPTITTTIGQTQHGSTTTSSSNVVLAAGHVNSLGILSEVFDVDVNEKCSFVHAVMTMIV